MNFGYIIGAVFIVLSIIGVYMAIYMKVEPYRHPGQPKADADPGPKPAMRKKPIPKKVCSSDWDGNGSNGRSYH